VSIKITQTEKANHSPGPWQVRDLEPGRTARLTDSTGRYIGDLQCRHNHPGYEAERVADARLIAAAPDLLAAALGMLNPTGHTDACTELREFGHTNCTKPCARLREAIEKAKGEQL
jgi:hypothetical protein